MTCISHEAMLYLGQADCWKNKNNAKPVTKVLVTGTSYTNPAISVWLKRLKHNWSVNLMSILSQISCKVSPTAYDAILFHAMLWNKETMRTWTKQIPTLQYFIISQISTQVRMEKKSEHGTDISSAFETLHFELIPQPNSMMDGWISLGFVLYLRQPGCTTDQRDFTGEFTPVLKKKQWVGGKGRRSEEIKTVVLKCRWMISHLNSLQTPTTHFLCIQ